MAQGVVDGLESVQVDEEQVHGETLADGEVQDARGVPLQVGAVVHAGQGVAHGQLFELGVLQGRDQGAGQDVAEVAEEIRGLVRGVAFGVGVVGRDDADGLALLVFVPEGENETGSLRRVAFEPQEEARCLDAPDLAEEEPRRMGSGRELPDALTDDPGRSVADAVRDAALEDVPVEDQVQGVKAAQRADGVEDRGQVFQALDLLDQVDGSAEGLEGVQQGLVGGHHGVEAALGNLEALAQVLVLVDQAFGRGGGVNDPLPDPGPQGLEVRAQAPGIAQAGAGLDGGHEVPHLGQQGVRVARHGDRFRPGTAALPALRRRARRP
ncbi:hypothetical protein DSECCO2_494830 [anaerobic digester metagenome]